MRSFPVVQPELSALHRTIKQRIDAGELPSDVSALKCWAGKSSGGRCCGCDAPIDPEETEYEVVVNEDEKTFGSLAFHRKCLDVWLMVCRQRTE